MTQSDLEDERTRKRRRKSLKKVGSHFDDHKSSSDDSDTEDERTKRHKRTPSRISEKQKDKDKQRRREKNHRHKEKRHRHKQEYLGRDKDDGVRRSVISGKKIHLKVEKSKEDKLAETSRTELLKFLNASYD